MAELKALVGRRGILKGQLTKFGTFLDDLELDNTKVDELQIRLDKLEVVWSSFADVQTQIELIDNAPAQESERDEFENKYFKLVSIAKKKLKNSSETKTTSSSTQKDVVLPRINLPEFTGCYETWYSFHDTFNTLIHSNHNLNSIQKYQYLRAALKGEAAQVIQSLEVSEANYNTAWELLKKRYENKKVIIKAHVKAIFELPNINNTTAAIRQFTDSFERHFRALKNLELPVDKWDTILIYLLINKLDPSSRKDWETQTNDKDCPTIQEFIDFLTKRCRLLESLDSKHQVNKRIEFKAHSHTVTNGTCPFCKESHYIFYCKKFLDMNCSKRLSEIKRLNLCINCLKKGHSSSNCQSRGCKTCNKKHNTLLHFDSRNDGNTSSAQAQPIAQQSIITSHCSQFSSKLNLLSTAIIHVFNSQNKPARVRCLLDNGSQSNFMTRDLLKRLNLRSMKINIPVIGINSTITNISSQTSTDIGSLHNNYRKRLNFLIIDNITEDIPQFDFSISTWDIPSNISLADPKFYESAKIDVLLGVSVFYDLLRNGQIKLGKDQPILQNSEIGWIISGSVNSSSSNTSTRCNFTANLDIQNQIEKFWLIEHGPSCKPYSREEAECEENFVRSFARDKQTGRFSVCLPLRENYEQLGESISTAEKRFYLLERKLSNNPSLKIQYCNFMEEYKKLGHMSKITPERIASDICFYLPHHCVQNTASITTKLRVVFDGSSKSSSGLSLNDVIKVGPSIQEELFSILIRLRKHNIVITADIEKMYRQVEVTPQHRDLQRILWRSDPSQPLEHYTLNTVTYGTSAASFLATRCLKQLAVENMSIYPTASQVILQDFYVDDLITGCPDMKSATRLIEDLEHIMKGACFQLRKWSSNNALILEDLRRKSSSQSYIISREQNCKTLGLAWNPIQDSFNYTTTVKATSQGFTKRQILSLTSQIFDPLGLLGPIIVNAKIIMQKLWLEKLDWDDPIPDSVAKTWNEFIQNLPTINEFNIPRQVVIPKFKTIEMHAFSDASQVAYGACIYIRSVSYTGEVLVRILTAKSRVAPIKTLTIPRLELCAALLMVRLVEKVISFLRVQVENVSYYTDSMIVLSWLKLEPGKLKQFVSHRIAEMQEKTLLTQWNHVPSLENPADILSRGADPAQLLNLSLWWHGPSWLRCSEQPYHWSMDELSIDIPEMKSNVLCGMHSLPFKSDMFDKFSSFTKLQRITAYCLRFVNIARKNMSGPIDDRLSIAELNHSVFTLIKLVQAEEFSQELHSLQKSMSLPRNSKLVSLDPFVDDKGILRVGGRLQNASIPYDTKFPILLPARHNFTKLLIEYEHKRNLHSGTQTTLAAIRTTYWPINGKQAVRNIIRKCITCFRASPRVMDQKMGNLPSARVNPNRAFTVCGIDYAGPFIIKDGKLRNRNYIKAYLCLFICFSSKAVHLELVTDLSTQSFLNGLKRFVSRRGLCQQIISDNATNFRGANNELKRLHKLPSADSVRRYLVENQIKWNFIPPKSPHHGGLWEANIKTAKYHLTRMTSQAKLTYEEFLTLICQIEAIMNSRPLAPLSSDPSDLEPITPGHFLVGGPLNAVPQPNLLEETTNIRCRYEYLQRLTHQFWKQWSRNYLHTLQQRSKWRFSKRPSTLLGALVLLKEDALPPQRWCLGRIIAVHPGQDAEVRVVTVRTQHGAFKRAVTKICLLPLDTSYEQD